MSQVIRTGILLVVIGVCVAVARYSSRGFEREVDRQFVPGAIGRSYGHSDRSLTADGRGQTADPEKQHLDFRPPPPASGFPSSGSPPRRFLSRAMSGVDSQWGKANGLTARLAFSHNLGGVFPPELYKEHPEFFPLVDGKRLEPPKGSYFWNPDIARPDAAVFAAEAARKYFETHPGEASFALGVNDALVWGESGELLSLIGAQERSAENRGQRAEGGGQTTWFRERPDYSNLVFTFMNRAAEELARTHPDRNLGALAYYWAENAPSFPLHPAVIPFLTADRSQGYDASFRSEEFELQMKWARASGVGPALAAGPSNTGLLTSSSPTSEVAQHVSAPLALRASAPPSRLGMYDYLYGGGFLIPRIWTKLLAENLKHARKAGFTDYYAEVNPNWGLDGPMPWLAAQLLQDTEQSEMALLDEYYRRYFQEAAEPMRRFFERCEELWMGQPGPGYWLKHYRNESQAVIFPSSECRFLRAFLNEALMRVGEMQNSGIPKFQRPGMAKVRQRVRLVSDAFGVTERFVTFQEARTRLTRLALTPLPLAQNLAAALEEYLNARGEFIRYTKALQKTSPLAVRAFGWDDYLKNDPVALALGALARVRNSGSPEGQSSGNAGRNRPGSLEFRPSGLPASGLARTEGHELLYDAGMTGAVKSARVMAGLPYGVALPAGWQSRVEPAQHHRAEFTGSNDARVLRISGSKDSTVSQWAKVGGEGLHQATVAVRGHVSPGTAVRLVFSWLDKNERHVGYSAVRLPDGPWPEWVTLRQAGTPPEGAVWVGLGLRVQNQVGEDWVEANRFSIVGH